MNRLQVNLSQDTIKLVGELASARNKKQSKFGAMTHGNIQDSYKAHFIGMLGEAAVAYIYGVDIDRKIYENRGDNGIDLKINGYGKVQVKTTTYTNKPLLRIEVDKINQDVDTFFCCSVDLVTNTIWVVGWADKKQVLKKDPVKLMKNGPLNYILSEDELNSYRKQNLYVK